MFLFQADVGLRGLVRSRGLGDVYKGPRSNIPAISEFTYTRLDPTYPERAKEYQDTGSLIVGGDNYGQGSCLSPIDICRCRHPTMCTDLGNVSRQF